MAQVKPAAVPEPLPEHYPVPEPQAPAVPLPALDASDAAMKEGLAGLLGADAFGRFFRLESLVRHLVVTIDNLPRKTFAMRLSPLKPVGGLIVVSGKDEAIYV